jgi:hypothetical protein
LHSWNNEDSLYVDECFNSKNLFGCIGLKHRKYCILNKQYSAEQYEVLVPAIIEHMRKTGEWGEFFPGAGSQFAYNETIAHDEFPLSKENTENAGWRWAELSTEEPAVSRVIAASQLPDSIDDIPDPSSAVLAKESDIVNWAVKCEATGKLFRIIHLELDFYRSRGLPIPRRSPEQRYRERLTLRNPRRLWNRECTKCQKQMATSYSPERSERVYCEECYLKEVY